METKQVKQTKQVKKVEEVQPVQPVQVTSVSVESVQETSEVTQEEVVVESFHQVTERLSVRLAEATKALKEAQQDFKLMTRVHQREVKSARKNKRQHSNGESKRLNPSGFNKPTLVPESLVKFLLLEPGVEMPRTKVTSALYAYVKSNGLQSHMVEGKLDKRTIVPDDKLRKLFSLGKDETIEFKTFQTHVSKLYNSEKVTNGFSGKEVVDSTPVTAATTVVATTPVSASVEEKKVVKPTGNTSKTAKSKTSV
jgi:chromatin remodeling complex protein RSC6